MGRFAGIIWIALASTSFAGMGAFIKLALRDVSVWHVVLWRGVIVALIAWILLRLGGHTLRPGNPRLLAIRSVIGHTAAVCYFWSLGQIELATATTLLYTSPIFTVLLSGWLLGERREARLIPLVLTAFVGIGLIVQPGRVDVELGTLAALSSGLVASLAYLAVRKLRETDPPGRIVFYFAAFSSLASVPFAAFDPGPQSGLVWLGVFGVGITAAGGQLFMTQAYRVERANVVGPFSYLAVVVSFALGVTLFDERLSPMAIVGMLCVVGAGGMLAGVARARAPGQERTQ